MIPRVIFQIAKLPLECRDNYWKQTFPNYEYIFYNDKNNVSDFFKKHPSKSFPNIIKTWKSLSRGESRTDLFRYYYLYKKGGLYFDSDLVATPQLHDTMSSIANNTELILVNTSKPPFMIFNGLLAARPKHPIFFEAIRRTYTRNLKISYNYFTALLDLYQIYTRERYNNTIIWQEEKIKVLNSKNQIVAHHYWREEQPYCPRLKNEDK